MQELIGNNAIHAGAVLPLREPPLNDSSAPLHASIQVTKNGSTLSTATRVALPEGPFGSVVRLAEHLADSRLFLEEGQIVLTGSPLSLYRVAEGDRIEVSCDRSETVGCFISFA